jgi:PAS domain S-box-containing protein
MEPKKFKALLNRTILVPVAALAILAAFLLGETQSLTRAMHWVDHTDQVIGASQQLINLVLDMETGLRGYLNTGRDVFLQPYQQAASRIDAKFDAVNRLVSDSPAQQTRLAEIRSRVEQWRIYADGLIVRRRTGEQNDYEVNLQGKQLMDSVRAANEDFVAVEEQLRNERVRTVRHTARVATLSCILLSLGVGTFLATFTRRRLRLLAADFQGLLDHAEIRSAELAKSEERWRTLFNTMDEGFCVVEMIFDPDGKPSDYRFLQVNPAFERQTGLHGAEGKRMGELAPAHEAHWFEIYGNVAITGESAHFVNEARQLDRWFDVRAYRVGDPEMRRVAIVFNDISENKRAEKALRESQAQFRTLADAIPQLCWIADADGFIFWYNQRWYEYTGTTPEQMEGWGWQSVHDPDALPQVMERWKDSIATGNPFDRVLPMRGADGVFRPFLTRVMPLKDAEGKVVRWFGTNTDVTELRNTQQALEASEHRWATTLQSIGDAVISTDAAGNIEFMNDVAQSLTGWPLTDARGRDLSEVFDIIQEVSRIRPESPAAKVMRLGTVVGLANHTVLIQRNGTEIPIEDSAAPIRASGGQIEGIVLVFHDVLAQRRVEAVLRSNERLATTGRLAATIAHEIHNPLDAVGNLLYLIGQDTREDTTREHASMASGELMRVTQMTQQMLAFQREAAKPVPVKIGELIANVVALYQRKVNLAGIRLEQQNKFDGHIVMLPGELRQVIANLIGNAIEAVAPRRGIITVRAHAGRDRRRGLSGLCIAIADNGPGIPPDVRAKIFEPFFTTKGENGTGLGLWITSDIVQKYDGAMRLRTCTQPHRSGTCFSIFFPFQQASDSPQVIPDDSSK